MVNEMTEEQLLLRNLRDAGCDEATIRQYLKLKMEGKEKEQLRLLSIHRASLLERVHVSQQMIDCLDYLIFTMKKTK